MISIIGGGPSGNYAAYLLAKAGQEVEVFEEHRKTGQCAWHVLADRDERAKYSSGRSGALEIGHSGI